jgi:cytochrome d ubiquinol oxidase subunit I
MAFDPVLLSRLQFAMTAGFHFIFPIISLGLVWFLAGIELLAWRTGNDIHRRLAGFVGKLFALTFALGVATGITMEFQFGTNWGEYSKMVGDIFGAPLAIEAAGFFFLESTMLGLYLFGRDKVPRVVHVGSIVLVAVAATMSAFWILVANSWQQTPAGYVLNSVTHRAELSDFWAAVFNPSTLPRFFHTMTAGLIAGAFFLAGIAAWLLIKDRQNAVARSAMRLALIIGFVASVAELHPFGHMHAVQVARTQPEKLATIEGLYEGGPNAPSLVFGIPLKDRVAMQIRIPGLLSRMVGGSKDTVVQGRNDFPPEDLPPVFLPFAGFHLMVGLGMLFIAMTGYGLFQLLRGRLWSDRLFLYALVGAIPLPVLACELGWMTAEVGRQPWAVYKILRTSDAVSRVASAEWVLFSLAMFAFIYVLLGALYVFLAARIVKKGPESL